MDRYQRVEKKRSEQPINENEIRINSQGVIRNYITAISLLQEKKAGVIVLKAMGQAISKKVLIAEIIKKRIPGLHQETSISSMSITDTWEPIEEGLEMTRQVSLISISLSTKELNKNSPGYQAPSQEQPKHQYQSPQQQKLKHVAIPGVIEGRIRARGRGRGWGRTSYRNYPENGNYWNQGQGGGRGQGGGQDRGWGYRDGGYGRGMGGVQSYGQGRGRGQQA